MEGVIEYDAECITMEAAVLLILYWWCSNCIVPVSSVLNLSSMHTRKTFDRKIRTKMITSLYPSEGFQDDKRFQKGIELTMFYLCNS